MGSWLTLKFAISALPAYKLPQLLVEETCNTRFLFRNNDKKGAFPEYRRLRRCTFTFMFPVPTRSTTRNHIGQRIKTSAIDNIEQECLPVNTEQEFKIATTVKDIITSYF